MTPYQQGWRDAERAMSNAIAEVTYGIPRNAAEVVAMLVRCWDRTSHPYPCVGRPSKWLLPRRGDWPGTHYMAPEERARYVQALLATWDVG